MRRSLAPTVSSLLVAFAATTAAMTPTFRAAAMQDVDLRDGQSLTAALRSGPVRIDMPFTLLWGGRRWDALDVGLGWARATRGDAPRPGTGLAAVAATTIAGDVTAVRPRLGPRFDVLSGGLTLGPGARVTLVRRASQVVVRWWDLRAGDVSVAMELIIDRGRGVRFQYLQVHALVPRLASPPAAPVDRLTAGISGAGRPALRLMTGGVAEPSFTLRNGLSIAFTAPDERISLASAPPTDPPPGCDPPIGTWCDLADGPVADTLIHLDTRFQEPSASDWVSTNGLWHIIDVATCGPGATTDPGQSAYVGDDATCTWTGPDDLSSPLFGPASASTMLTFLFRVDFVEPDAFALIIVNGDTLGRLDPAPLDPTLWYSVNPIDLSAYAGLDVTLAFRFETSGAPAGLGWMIDDIFVWEERGANMDCVRPALYDGRDPALSSCADTVSDQWTFNETWYCNDCIYTFYALVECGTVMHLPLADMEGAEVTITEVVSGTSPALTCENDAFRDPATAPLLVEQECCSAEPGLERWRGPAFSATDSLGPGAVSWGFDLTECGWIGSVDLPPFGNENDVIDCVELDPACGGESTRHSPGEGQGMDCRIEGSPGLCGIYRIDVRSGGFAWELFANCIGDTTPRFDLYTSCEDAWTAFTPLPELAIGSLIETGTCPDTELEFTIENVGCADHPGDILIRAESNCSTPDLDEWILTGGLAANASRTETRSFTVSCPDATVTLYVDPDAAVDECSESGNAAACDLIPGADSLSLGVCDCAGTQPPAATASLVCESTATDLSCGPPVAGATYEWDFEDDGSFDATGCDQSHVYPGPGMYSARVRMTTADSCVAETVVDVEVLADAIPTDPTLIHAVRVRPTDAVEISWSSVPGAATYRVARGTIRNYYDHTVDDTIGAGMCDTLGATTFTDPDDYADPLSFYYLVAPLSACGTPGPWGNGADATPPPIPSASCP